MINLILNLLKLLQLFLSAAKVVVPTSPLAIQLIGDEVIVSCLDTPYLLQIGYDFQIQETNISGIEIRDLCLWSNEIVASDYISQSIITRERSISLPGSPDGICEVYWDSDSIPELAVALFDMGFVLLIDWDGSFYSLIEIPNVKSLVACDADNDGDMDIFASACGSGISLIENCSLTPVLHSIGNIEDGVKRCCTSDVNRDGLIDIIGIACASGGVGWWQNPGSIDRNWIFHELDETLMGPKDVFCKGDSIVVSSLFSEVLISWDSTIRLPSGFTCCAISDNGYLILGHKLGYVVFLDLE